MRNRKQPKDFIPIVREFYNKTEQVFSTSKFKQYNELNKRQGERDSGYTANFDEREISNFRKAFEYRYMARRDPITKKLITPSPYALAKQGIKTLDKLLDDNYLEGKTTKQILTTMVGRKYTQRLEADIQDYGLAINEFSLGGQLKQLSNKAEAEGNSENPIVELLVDLKEYALAMRQKSALTYNKYEYQKGNRRLEEINQQLRDSYQDYVANNKQKVRLTRKLPLWVRKR